MMSYLYMSIYFCMVEWQKCIAVIERKVLVVIIVSLFANASDYSNKTCIYMSMCLYLTKYISLVGVVFALPKSNTISTFLSITAIHFCHSTIRKYTDIYKYDVTTQIVCTVLKAKLIYTCSCF